MIYNDVEGFRQAIEPFIRSYKIKRALIREYNERGRVNNVKTINNVNAFIEPGGKRINTDGEGKGRWVTADYTVYCVVPEYISMGDLIFTEQFGTLKIVSIDDNRQFGVMSGSAVRTGTTETTATLSNNLYEPD